MGIISKSYCCLRKSVEESHSIEFAAAPLRLGVPNCLSLKDLNGGVLFS
jgi:hypothetical protein